MRMFNYVKVEGDWLPDEIKQLEFQTKDDLEEPNLETFTITKDGRLMFERCTYKWEPDPAKLHLDGLAVFQGALKTTSRKLIDENFHGDFHFYNEKINCVARFTNGQLEHITYGAE